MKILDDFKFDFGDLIKALGESAPHAAPSAGAAAAAAMTTPHSATPQGAEQRKQGGKYIKRWWDGGKWKYQYHSDGSQHKGAAHFNDQHHLGEHHLQLPDDHPMTAGGEKDAYHQQLASEFEPDSGKKHTISHPHPDKAGENLHVSVSKKGRYEIHNDKGELVHHEPSHGAYEAWHRGQQSGPMQIMGPSGKPWADVTATQGKVSDKKLVPKSKEAVDLKTGKAKQAGNAWKASAVEEKKGADPAHTPNIGSQGLRGENRAAVLNQLKAKMIEHEKGGHQFPPEEHAKVDAAIQQTIASDPEAAKLFETRKEGGRKGALKQYVSQEEADQHAMSAASAVQNKLISANYVRDQSGKAVFNPALKDETVKELATALAPVIQFQMASSIKKLGVDDHVKDAIAQALFGGTFKDLNDPKKALNIVATAGKGSGLHADLSNALDNYDPRRRNDKGQSASIDTYAMASVKANISKLAAIHSHAVSNTPASLEGMNTSPDGDEHERVGNASIADAGAASISDQAQHAADQQRMAAAGSKKEAKTPEQLAADKQWASSYLASENESSPEVEQSAPAPVTGNVAQIVRNKEGDVDKIATMNSWRQLQHKQLSDAIASSDNPKQRQEMQQAVSVLPRIKDENTFGQFVMTMNELGHGQHLSEISDEAFKSLMAIIKAMFAMQDLQKADPLTLSRDKKVDPAHTYSHVEGDEDHPKFFFRDSAGNYLRYSNAPTGHKDYSGRFGEAAIHPSEPVASSASQFFDLKGRKLTRAPNQGAEMQWNRNYHRDDPHNLWAGRWVNPTSGDHEYTYLDADFRENPNLRRHQEVVLTDMRIPALRQAINALSNSPHVKDNVTATALALIDQGHFRSDELASLTVSDVIDFGALFKVANRYVYPDHKFRSMLDTLTKDRTPDEPLFAVPFVKKNNEVDVGLLRRVGKHYLICTLDQLGLSFDGLQSYHATQTFSREVQRLIIESHVPWSSAVEYATLAVAQELGVNLSEDPNMEQALIAIRETYIDPIALALLEENTMKLGLGGVAVTLPLPPPPVLYVSMNLTSRTADEEVFSRWLHNFYTHLPDVATTPLANKPNSPNETEMAA